MRKLDEFESYLVPFNFDDKIEVQITRNGVEVVRQIELMSFRVYGKTKAENSAGNFSVRYYDTHREAYTQKELVEGFIRKIPEVIIPHSQGGYVCYCSACNYERAKSNGILLGGEIEDIDLPF